MRTCLMLSVLILICVSVPTIAAPQISLDNAVYDFGDVLEGEPVVHTFVLTNTGSNLLVVQQVRPSCGCTATMLSQKSLAPGESVDLKATLSTQGYGGRTITKTITVYSNDPERPEVLLSLTGTVIENYPYGISVSDLGGSFYLLIDLRDPEIYASGHLMGAINIPWQEIDNWFDNLPHRVRIILYDQDGSLSNPAAKMLNEQGFPDAVSLLGGLDEWIQSFGERFVVSFKLSPPE